MMLELFFEVVANLAENAQPHKQNAYLCGMKSMSKNFKAVLFDLDGTLINSLHDIADSMNRVLASKGYKTHDYDAYRYFIGNGLKNLVRKSLPDNEQSERNVTNLFEELLQEYEQNLLRKTRLYQGIPDLLDALTERNMRMGVLSNKADALTKAIAATLLSGWKFDAILGASEAFPRKPDPASALHLSQLLDCPPQSVLYVGDTSIDMKTAVAAGMYPVGVSWGFRTRDELLENGAKSLIEKPLDLLDLLA